MGKIYVFGIGGTGSRVIKALMMLLSAGVEMKADSVIPVIIDPDQGAGDVSRTIDLIRTYMRVYEKLERDDTNKNKFFYTRVEEIIKDCRLELANTSDDKFKDYMGFDGLNLANKSLANILFSEENLESEMNVGFKGNPNIGSVVLNQFLISKDFEKLASTFSEGDRIFIVSSIFGGTGASGFPVLLKNLRTLKDARTGSGSTLPNAALIQSAPIGALSVLPYFGVKPEDTSKIDEGTFISKTKAALSYYEKNMDMLNSLYYIGDEIKAHYDNVEGGKDQRNKAHFVELVGALSIIDFAKTDKEDLINREDGSVGRNVYKEFGIKDDVSDIVFGNLCKTTYDMTAIPMTKFSLFVKYMTEQLNDSLDQPWAKDRTRKLGEIVNSSFYTRDMKKIAEMYVEWLFEMSANTRAFSPFDLTEKKDDLFNWVKGVKTKSIPTFKKNYALFDDRLNSIEPSIKNDKSKEQRFVELFYQTVEKLVSEKLQF